MYTEFDDVTQNFEANHYFEVNHSLYEVGQLLCKVGQSSHHDGQLLYKVDTKSYEADWLLCEASQSLYEASQFHIIRASLNEPHTCELNGGIFIYIYYISVVCQSINAS